MVITQPKSHFPIRLKDGLYHDRFAVDFSLVVLLFMPFAAGGSAFSPSPGSRAHPTLLHPAGAAFRPG
jgi:hypothetical protein